MTLKYTVMSHCVEKCSSLLRGLYIVKLCKITYCTALQRKFIFDLAEYLNTLSCKLKEILVGIYLRSLKRIIHN